MLIFGYGSLLNADEVWRNGMEKRYTYDELIPVTLLGYQREWNVVWRGQLYLGLIRKEDAMTNGVIFDLEMNDLTPWCESEGIGMCNGNDMYILQEVNGHIPEAFRHFGDRPIYTCVTRKPSMDGTIPKHYVPIVKAGLEYWGEAFTQAYEQSTFPYPYSKESGQES